jgi:hypothetical protein
MTSNVFWELCKKFARQAILLKFYGQLRRRHSGEMPLLFPFHKQNYNNSCMCVKAIYFDRGRQTKKLWWFVVRVGKLYGFKRQNVYAESGLFARISRPTAHWFQKCWRARKVQRNLRLTLTFRCHLIFRHIWLLGFFKE